ncbi:MAG: type 2 isopentenyl-diphosphate Delta-isomerase [Bacteroidetes bacterium]|nr:type 2 isopentenyl-diphosphate Delta-isomerase [Bacteroidota bacterium]
METPDSDPSAPSRKADHIQLAFASQVDRAQRDERFNYEPLLAAHPGDRPRPVPFLGKTLSAPLWISSMTGGTGGAGQINHRLARACGEFGLGMGLGSCRSLLNAETHWPDFDVRAEMGEKGLLFANLGIAQIERSLKAGAVDAISAMVQRLRADGLTVHVNPLQEWLQPEGDRIERPPLETIQEFLEQFQAPVMVKEVGQGMGPASLEALLRLPLAAVDFAAQGGTNFSMVELLRGTEQARQAYTGLSRVGHTAPEMVEMVHALYNTLANQALCRQIIVSGGIRDFLDGYWLVNRLPVSAVYAQGSAFLRPAKESYEALQSFVAEQLRGLALAEAYLRVRQA